MMLVVSFKQYGYLIIKGNKVVFDTLFIIPDL